MSRDYLTSEQIAVLGRAHRRTVIAITLNDGTPLKFSTADTELSDDFYLGKLAPIDALNLELTAAVEGIDLKISNEYEQIGQNLINAPDIISGTSAVLGAYFYDELTNQEWIDPKITGEIVVGDIDGDWVNIFFTSKIDSVEYAGVSVASAFPDSQIAAQPDAQPVYNDVGISSPIYVPGIGSKTPPLMDSFEMNLEARYALPAFQIENY